MSLKIYISGKITGDPDYREKFTAAADKLAAPPEEDAESTSQEMDWSAAKGRLDFYIEEYRKIGPTEVFGLMTLCGLETRYEKGERTRELYDDMMSVE